MLIESIAAMLDTAAESLAAPAGSMVYWFRVWSFAASVDENFG